MLTCFTLIYTSRFLRSLTRADCRCIPLRMLKKYPWSVSYDRLLRLSLSSTTSSDSLSRLLPWRYEKQVSNSFVWNRCMYMYETADRKLTTTAALAVVRMAASTSSRCFFQWCVSVCAWDQCCAAVDSEVYLYERWSVSSIPGMRRKDCCWLKDIRCHPSKSRVDGRWYWAGFEYLQPYVRAWCVLLDINPMALAFLISYSTSIEHGQDHGKTPHPYEEENHENNGLEPVIQPNPLQLLRACVLTTIMTSTGCIHNVKIPPRLSRSDATSYWRRIQ